MHLFDAQVRSEVQTRSLNLRVRRRSCHGLGDRLRVTRPSSATSHRAAHTLAPGTRADALRQDVVVVARSQAWHGSFRRCCVTATPLNTKIMQ
jgi:hypothetical protein